MGVGRGWSKIRVYLRVVAGVAVAACVLSMGAAHVFAALHVEIKSGTLVVGGKRFKAATDYVDALALNDGTVIAVRLSGEMAESSAGPVDSGVVVRVDPTSGKETLLLKGRVAEDTEATLLDLAGLAASPSGDVVYVYARTVWPSVGAVWAMKPDGRGAKFLAPAGMKPAVVQSGPWKAHILTTQQLHFSEGGSWFPPVLLDPASGRVEAVCRKAPEEKQSLEAELVPYVPLNGLALAPKVPLPKD